MSELSGRGRDHEPDLTSERRERADERAPEDATPHIAPSSVSHEREAAEVVHQATSDVAPDPARAEEAPRAEEPPSPVTSSTSAEEAEGAPLADRNEKKGKKAKAKSAKGKRSKKAQKAKRKGKKSKKK